MCSKISSADIEMLAVLVKIDGKVYSVAVRDKNKDVYLRTIATYEGGVKIIDKPLNSLRMDKGE